MREAGEVGCAVFVVGRDPLNTGNREEQGEEGPSTDPQWVCEALQSWGQLERE